MRLLFQSLFIIYYLSPRPRHWFWSLDYRCLAMALRLASQRVGTVFNGFTRASILESRIYRRNATAMAVPSSSLPDGIRNEIFVGLESISRTRRICCAEQFPRQKPLYLLLILIPTLQR